MTLKFRLRGGINLGKGNLGTFYTYSDYPPNDPIEQEKRIKYIDVLANAVIIQNAVDMTRILRELAAEGYTVTRETISYLSPYLTEHIRRFGQYRIDMELLPPPIQLDEPLLDVH